MRELYERICAGEDLRANLIALKAQLKTEGGEAAFRAACADRYDTIMKCLVDPDPKVRKNAADILGMLKVQEAADVLMDAWREEETRFVRPDYVRAMAALDCGEYAGEFRARLDELTEYDVPANEKKHVQAEIAALRKLLFDRGGFQKHVFTGYGRANEVILTTLPAFREILSADLPFRKVPRGDGIALFVGDMNVVLACRYWQEMLFVLHAGGPDPPAEAAEISRALQHSDLLEILTRNHRGDPPYYFRVGVTGPVNRGERGDLARQAGAAVEEAFGGDLINSVSHYEAEIRVAADREGRAALFLKLFTIPDDRFRYRRYYVSAGMKPYVAAGLIGLAKPYLKDHAQILDPFCGVGTLLIERRFAGPVRSAYGIDTFGEAIDKARRNAQIAGMPVNYINRNFFDFTHDYLFDEIITDMPERVGGSAEAGMTSHAQMDDFYCRFLEKSVELLAPGGRIFCYTAEVNLLRKHLRLNERFRLLREIPILKRTGTSLFIMELKENGQERA